MADFDRIIFMSIMALRTRELVKLCRSYAMESTFIDGTHDVGNLEVSNLRKWMSAPSTTALNFYCKSEPLVAVPEAIKFGKGVFGSVEDCSKENHCEIVAVEEMLARASGTHLSTVVVTHDT